MCDGRRWRGRSSPHPPAETRCATDDAGAAAPPHTPQPKRGVRRTTLARPLPAPLGTGRRSRSSRLLATRAVCLRLAGTRSHFLPAPNRSPRPFLLLPLLISGLCAILALQMAWHDPRYLLPFLLIVTLVVIPPFL